MPLFTAEVSTAFCPDCAADRPVEQPPCPDDHGTGCPERICTDCGTALLMAGPTALLTAPAPLTEIRGAA